MPATFANPNITREVRSDGSEVVRSTVTVTDHPETILESFFSGARSHPDRLLVAERHGSSWLRRTWGEMASSVTALARGLGATGVGGRPLMILSHNSIANLEMTLAGYVLRSPVVPASVAYSLQTRDHAKLRAMAAVVEPAVVFAESDVYAPAVDALGGEPLVVGGASSSVGVPIDRLRDGGGLDTGPAAGDPTGDDIAKILFTSGSTGHPKGVINSHRMLAANQQQMRQVWPFLADEPPVLLDWLPWSHTFGGNHNVNMILTNGGSLWIDNGRPAPDLIGATVANLADVSPTVYFNVPAGYAALVPELERDDAAAARFFADLRLMFYAAAALPQELWDRLEALAARHGGRAQMTTSWGMTETAPGATTTHFPTSTANSIGVPLPGVEVKLVPQGSKKELRVRGPNITPGFYGRPELAETAFDDEGFLRTGDACAMVDPEDPAKGLCFDGRIAEDFKLSTGTFVSVGTLRPRLVSACGGRIIDAVICGHDTEEVSALVWLHPDHDGRHRGGLPDDALRAELQVALEELAGGGGSSQRVQRLLIMETPAALDAGEITDKGYVNQARVRELRADLVDELVTGSSPRIIHRVGASAAV